MNNTSLSSKYTPKAPPVDPELAGPLTDILRHRPPSLLPEMIEVDRARIDTSRLSNEEVARDGAFTVSNYPVPTKDGEFLDLLLARPSGATRVPVILNIHGGGLVAGHNRSPELVPELNRAQELGLAVASVTYRLAPENPHPIPVEDCYTALCWLSDHCEELALDRDEIIISGASAGGCLAAAVSLLARDRGGPGIRAQMLYCPMLDDRVESLSANQMRGRGLWDTTSNETGWDALLQGQRGAGDTPPTAAPARAERLNRLPPTYVEVGTYESLRDEAVSFAARLSGEGVDVELHMWGGAFHSFDEWVPDTTISKTAHRVRCDWLRRRLRLS